MQGNHATESYAGKLAFVERAVEDLQAAHKKQGESVYHELYKLQVKITKAFEEILRLQANTTKALEDVQRSLTPTIAAKIDRAEAASTLGQMEMRLQQCEGLVNSVTATSNGFVPIYALKAIEERLNKLEKLQKHVAQEQRSGLFSGERLDETPHTPPARGATFEGEGLDEIPHTPHAREATSTPELASRFSTDREEVDPQSIGAQHVTRRQSLDTTYDTPTPVLVERMQSMERGLNQYFFQQSVYDAAFFMFSKSLSKWDSLMIFVALGLNMVMQVGVVGLLGTDKFTSSPFSEDAAVPYRKFRYAHSHSFENADENAGISLAARVCQIDLSLDVSSTQMGLLEEASDYMDQGKGLFLRNVAIILWFLCCAREVRETLNFVLGIFHVPLSTPLSELLSHRSLDLKQESSRSVYYAKPNEILIISLSFPRLVLGLFLAASQIIIASLLLVYGCQWITNTTSLLELLLNASALSFVLDIDETIYSVVTPLPSQGTIASMHPLKIPTSGNMVSIPLMLMVACAAFVIINYFTEGENITKYMELLTNTMCGDKLDFVIGTTALGWTVFAESVPYSASPQLNNRRDDVAQFIIDKDPTADRYFLNISRDQTLENVAAVKSIAQMNLVDLTKIYPCVDLPWNPGAESDAKLGGLLWSVSGNEMLRNFTRCSEVKDFCHGSNTSRLAQNARFMCPITCGCANPKSGLWDLFQAEAGCPQTNCLHSFRADRESSHHECKDANLTVLKSTRNWEFMAQRMYEYLAINSSVKKFLTTVGCDALGFLSASQRAELCQSAGPFAFHGAGLMCPVSCGCLDPGHHDRLCPNC